MSKPYGNSEWTERLLKGGFAETIVAELFKELGFKKIYRFGMEHSMPMMLEELKKMNDPTSLMVRRMPDFVVIDRDRKRKKSHFIEVKYRKEGGYPVNEEDEKELEGNPYNDAVIVLLTKEYIFAKTVAKCKKEGFNQKDWLSCCRAFDFKEKDKEVIIKFKEKLKYLRVFYEEDEK